MATILIIIPYEFFPPKYGGALRSFYLLREMARNHKVYLLTVQPAKEFRSKHEWEFPQNVKVISSADHRGYRTVFNLLPDRIANAVNSRILKRSLFGKGNLYLLKTYPVLKDLLLKIQLDFVVYESMECFSVLHPLIKWLSPQTQHIYDAHNIDSELLQQHYRYEANSELKNYAARALVVEKKLHKIVSLCLVCSDTDREKMEMLNKGLLRVLTVPNGVDTERRLFDTNSEKHKIANLLFCGALDYIPNIEGILWFYQQVYPILKTRLPQLTLTIIGKMNQTGPYKELIADASVHFIGPVDSVVPYYQSSSLLIVPLLSGSGTRLKILEAMSMGNPVVSTKIGAEGLEIEDGKHIRLADEPEAFATHIAELLSKKHHFEKQRLTANEMVKVGYDWLIIGKKLNKEIDSLLQYKRSIETCKVG